MSIYSYLILAANSGMRLPEMGEDETFLDSAGLLRPADVRTKSWNLDESVTAVFTDDVDRVENERFYSPDNVGMSSNLSVESADDCYEGPGLAIAIFGYGYFFPWSNEHLLKKIQEHPKLRELPRLAVERFGGRFEVPDELDELCPGALVSVTEYGWAWLKSESF